MKPRIEGSFLVSWLLYSIAYGCGYAALRLCVGFLNTYDLTSVRKETGNVTR